MRGAALDAPYRFVNLHLICTADLPSATCSPTLHNPSVRCTHCTSHRWKGNSAAHGRYKRSEQGKREAMFEEIVAAYTHTAHMLDETPTPLWSAFRAAGAPA